MKRILTLLLLAAALIACIGCGGGAGGETEIIFFKAGKADAILVRSDDAVLLVDTGLEKNGDELTEALEELGIRTIDAVIVTHFDRDHVGGAAEIIETFDIGAVYQSNAPKDSDEYEAYLAALEETGLTAVTVSETISLSFGGLSVSIDGPAREAYETDPSNNSSLIVTLAFGDNTVLLTGDAEDDRLEEFLADYARPSGHRILKVPYHGHWQSMLPALVEAALPDAAVMTCSKSEPEEEELDLTQALLENAGAEVYRTYDGDITLVLKESGYTVTQE